MTWNVFYHNCNADEIEALNIFRHGRFREDTQEALKIAKNKAEFALIIKRELRYYFWSKSEYELIIRLTDDDRVFLLPWCGSRDPEGEKLEVTNEMNFDWLGFAKYHIDNQVYKSEAKIDIYDQVMFQFDEFINYMWNERNTV